MIIFVHIPKTAGSSFHRWLELASKGRIAWQGPTPNDPDTIFGDATSREKYAVYGGHFGYEKFKQFLTPADQVFAVLREPVVRAASLYNQIAVRDPSHRIHHEVVGKSIAEAAANSHWVRGEISNHQCWYLSNTRNFTGARSIIEGYKPHLCTMDQINRLTTKIAAYLGAGTVPKLPNRNASGLDHLSRLSPEDIGFLKECNSEDIKLYQWVRDNSEFS